MKRINHKIETLASGQINFRSVNALLGYIASLMLCGVSPMVCESVIDNFCQSVKKSTSNLLMQK